VLSVKKESQIGIADKRNWYQCQLRNAPSKKLLWTLLQSFQNPQASMLYSSLQTGSPKFNTTYRLRLHGPQRMQPISISPRYRDYMGYQDILLLTAALTLPHDSCESLTGSSTYVYASLLPTTRKLMDSVSEPSRHLNNTSVSSAMIDKNDGRLGLHLLSLPSIHQTILPIKTPLTEGYMAGTLAPSTSTMTMNSPPPLPKNGWTE